jgi:spore coat protein U-like protein
MKKVLVSTFALALVALAPAAFAAGFAPADLGLSVTVINNCTIATTPVAFGNYDPLSASPNQAHGTVVIACTRNSAPAITLGTGLHFTTNRQMSDGTNFMNYEIYQPLTNAVGAACAYTARWGTLVGETFTPTAPLDKNARSYNVCGQIPAGQDVAAAAFADTVVATVNF